MKFYPLIQKSLKDLKSLLNQATEEEKKFIEKNKDRIYLFIHIINSKSSTYVDLPRVRLMDIMTRKYIDIKKLLIKYDIIECDEKYLSSAYINYRKLDGKKPKCKKFAISKKYRNEEKERVEIEPSKHLKKKMEEWNEMRKLKSSNYKKSREEENQEQFIQMLDFEEDEAISHYKEEKEKENKEATNEQIESAQYAIKNLKENVYVKRDERGRLYSNVTNMSSSLFSYIKKKNNLIEFDVKNCQPYLIYRLSKNQFGELSDIEKFGDLCLKGEIYDLFAKKLGCDRKKAKNKLLTYFYSPQNEVYNIEIRKIFESQFPSILMLIDIIKDKNYKELAYVMQRTEAEIFINNLGPKLSDEGIFHVTKHDSVICRREDAEETLKIMNDYFPLSLIKD